MIREFDEGEMTSIELQRWHEFKEKFKGNTCRCYFITDFELGIGYDIYATILELNTYEDLLEIDESNSLNITDTENMLDKL
jgi:hypothetical protein